MRNARNKRLRPATTWKARLALGLATLAWLGGALCSWGGEKFIRLRSGPIATPEPHLTRPLAPQTAESPVSGLYLLQFTGPAEAPWRQTLQARGHKLIHYVPDDAFVIRLDRARLSELRALRFVRWIGEFLPQHKLDPRLPPVLAGRLDELIEIKLLIAPDATAEQSVHVLRWLRAPTQRHRLSLGTTLRAKANAFQLRALAQLDAVLWIEPAPKMRLVDAVSTQIVAGEPSFPSGSAHVHQLGFDGRGVTIAVADSGLDSGDVTEMHPDLAGRVDALFAYDDLPDASDEHSHGTHVAGIVAGNGATGEVDESGQFWGLGVAPGSSIVGQRIFDGTGDYRPPPSNAKLTQDAVRSGAYIGSNSWGDDTGGRYDLSAAEFDALVRDADAEVPGEQAYVLEFSAGNSGPARQSIGSPAVGKNVIASGATDNNRYEFPIYGEGQEVMADFSARGPAEDGRIKPDVVAPGTWIASLRSVFADDNNAWGPISDYYLYQGGTSQSGPHVSGAAAVLVQWYRANHGGATPSPALVKAMLINSADDMGTAVIPDFGDFFGGDEGADGSLVVGDTGPVPNQDEGWGRVNLVTLIDSDRRHELVDQGAGLSTGQVIQRRAVVGPGDMLKVTLVYTDVPGLPAAIPALVNDLDLEVIAPDGTSYRGNAFADGESVAGTPEGDRINNVEAVHVSTPQAGEWTIRVRAVNVVQDVHQRQIDTPEQDFALVISGQLPAPGEGVVSWSRDAYRAPDAAEVRLVDAQLAGQKSATVTVFSTTETNGLALALSAAGGTGTFLGQVELVSGQPMSNDDRLSANDGDELTVIYKDANPPGDRRSSARVDLQPPLISQVQSIPQFGRVAISWTTGEPSTAQVTYGITNAVTNVISTAGLRQQHRVVLPELTAGEVYYFFVASTDAAGNTATQLLDDRFYYRFVAPRPVSALLVYTPEALFAEGGLLSDEPYPGLESWTAPLDALGISYEVWDVAAEGRAPTAAELQPYRVVLWRPEELQAITPGMLPALTSYVQQGGALFVASLDLLTRLNESTSSGGFAEEVLRVASFEQDGGANSIAAVPGDPIGGSLALDLNYDAFPSGFFIEILGISWPAGPDHLTPATNGAPVFVQEDQRVVGVRFPRTGNDAQTGRVVFFSFALESVPFDAPGPNNRTTLVANALRFLTPELVGGSTIAFDQPAYTIPGNVVVEATDSQRSGAGQVKVTLANDAVGQTLDLAETTRLGVFRGRLTLQSDALPVAPGQLPARDGDTITATYVDASNGESLAEARVDTVKAVVSDVASEPSYNEALVSWATDKPTDALVRFGESGGDDSFLTRSAYNAELSTSHEVQLRGLLPDKTYYYQVVSRDAAGNMTIDNQGGQFYTVRTLQPLTAPWSDGLDEQNAGWVVYQDAGLGIPLFPGDDEDEGGGFSGTEWQFGAPENMRGVAPHSGTNVWATNLRGDTVDFAITDLISPAVSLVGGNRATLRFWQYYDFSVSGGDEDDPFGDFVLEAGQVALSTDNGATWKDLYATQDEFSADWEEVAIDLSKYAGQVVRFRFNYQLFAFNAGPRMGWMIDDVSVNMTALPTTEIHVTNNLAQAAFEIRGPSGITFSGSGLGFRTNAPPGIYVIQWRDVPYYTTPATQTNTLTDNGTLLFQGQYAYPDANLNGISDLWEVAFFGAATPGQSGDTDSDGDGASDRQEFWVGTKPHDATSRLVLESPVVQPNRTVKFSWLGATGREYQLEVSNDLVRWQAVGTSQRGTDAPLSVTLPALDPRLSYFLRLRVTP